MPLSTEQKQDALNKKVDDPLTAEEAEYVVALLSRQLLIHEYVTALSYWVDTDKTKARKMIETFVTADDEWIANLPTPMPEEWRH
jgi:hypothetical protein